MIVAYQFFTVRVPLTTFLTIGKFAHVNFVNILILTFFNLYVLSYWREGGMRLYPTESIFCMAHSEAKKNKM